MNQLRQVRPLPMAALEDINEEEEEEPSKSEGVEVEIALGKR
jgi:hypothetical protein